MLWHMHVRTRNCAVTHHPLPSTLTTYEQITQYILTHWNHPTHEAREVHIQPTQGHQASLHPHRSI